MSEMVERVARAIRAVMTPEAHPAFDDMGPTLRDLYASYARAAIEAMREPTEDMFGAWLVVQESSEALQWDACWRAMIDAALTS